MFRMKKNIQPTTNPAINNRIQYLRESTLTLEMRVLDTYAAVLSVNLYPENTPDREKAEYDAKIAKTKLVNSIAGYDSIRADIKSESERLNVKLSLYMPTSHEFIERVMKEIIRGNVR